MKIFIFEGISQLTKNYHSEGGLVVVAVDREHVNKLIEEENAGSDWRSEAQIELEDKDWDRVITYELEAVIPAYNLIKPRVFIFPNAGCC